MNSGFWKPLKTVSVRPIKLSREKAKRAESWIELEKSLRNQRNGYGYYQCGKVKGGFTVEMKTSRLPALVLW